MGGTRRTPIGTGGKRLWILTWKFMEKKLRQCSRSAGENTGKFTDDNAFKLEENHPVDRLMKAKKRGGKSTYIYEWVKNMKVNLNERPYGKN